MAPALPPPGQQKQPVSTVGIAPVKTPLSPESPSEVSDKSDDNQQQEPPKEEDDDSNNNNDDDEQQAPAQPPRLSISVPAESEAEEPALAAPLSPVRSLISKFADAPGSGSRSPSQRSESVAKLELTQPSPVKNIVNRFEVKPDQSLDALKFRTVRDFFPEERSIHVGAEKEKYDALTEQQKRDAEAEEEHKTARPGSSPARSTKSSTESPGDGQGKLKSIASRFENQQSGSLDNLKVRTVRDFFATGEEPTVRVSAEKQKYEAEKDKSLDSLKVRTVRDFFATGAEPTVRVSAEKQKFEALEKQQLEAKEKAGKKPGGDSATSTPIKAPSTAASAEQSPANTDASGAESADEAATTPSKAPVKRLASRFEMKFSKKPLDALPFRTVRNFFSSSETPSVRVGAEKEKFEAQKKAEAVKDKSLDDLKFRTVRDFFPTGEEPTVRVGAERQKFEALEKKQIQDAKDKEAQRKGGRAGQSPTKSETTTAAKTEATVETAVVAESATESTVVIETSTTEQEVKSSTEQDAEVVVPSATESTSVTETSASEQVTEQSSDAGTESTTASSVATEVIKNASGIVAASTTESTVVSVTSTTDQTTEVTQQASEVGVQSPTESALVAKINTSEQVTNVTEQSSEVVIESATESTVATEISTWTEVTEQASEVVDTKSPAKEIEASQSSDKHKETLASKAVAENVDIAVATSSVEESEPSQAVTSVEIVASALAVGDSIVETKDSVDVQEEVVAGSTETVVVDSEPVSVDEIEVAIEESSIEQTEEAILESIEKTAAAQSTTTVEEVKKEAVQTVTDDIAETSEMPETETIETSPLAQAEASVITTDVHTVEVGDEVAAQTVVADVAAESSENTETVTFEMTSDVVEVVKTEVDVSQTDVQSQITAESAGNDALVTAEIALENVEIETDGTITSVSIEDVNAPAEVLEVAVENSEVVAVDSSSVDDVATETVKITAAEITTESLEKVEVESNAEVVANESEQLEAYEVIATETSTQVTEIEVTEESVQPVEIQEQIPIDAPAEKHMDEVTTEDDSTSIINDSEFAAKVAESVVEMMESLLPETIAQVAVITSESAKSGELNVLESSASPLIPEVVDITKGLEADLDSAVVVTETYDASTIELNECVVIDADGTELASEHHEVIKETAMDISSEDPEIVEEPLEQEVVDHEPVEIATEETVAIEQTEFTQKKEIAVEATSSAQETASTETKLAEDVENIEEAAMGVVSESAEAAVTDEVEIDALRLNATFSNEVAHESTEVVIEESSVISTVDDTEVSAVEVDSREDGVESQDIDVEASEDNVVDSFTEEPITAEEASKSEIIAAVDFVHQEEKTDSVAQETIYVTEALDNEVAVEIFEKEKASEVDVDGTTEEVTEEHANAETEVVSDVVSATEVIVAVTSDRQVLSNERSFIVEADTVETEDTVVVRAPFSTDTELFSDVTPPLSSTSSTAIETTVTTEATVETASTEVDVIATSSTTKSTGAAETSTVDLKKTRSGSLSMRPTQSSANRTSVSKSRTSSFSKSPTVAKSPVRKTTDHSKPTTQKSSPDASHVKKSVKPAATRASPSASSKFPTSDAASATTFESVHKQRKSSIMAPTASSVAKKPSAPSSVATASTPVAKKPVAKKPAVVVSSPSIKRESSIETKRSSIMAPTASSSAKRSEDNTSSSIKPSVTVDTSAHVTIRTNTTPKVARSHVSPVAAEKPASVKRTVTKRVTSKSFDVKDRLDAGDRRKSIATPTKPVHKTDATAHRRLSLTSRSLLRSNRTRHGAEQNTMSDGDDALKSGDACSNESQASNSEPSDPFSSSSTGRSHKAKLGGVVPRYMDYQNDPNFAKHAQMQYERRKRLEEINALKSAERQHALRHFFADKQMQVYQQNVEEIRRGEQQHEFAESNRAKQRELEHSIRKEKALAREEARAARKEHSGSSSVPRPSPSSSPHARGLRTPRSAESKRTTTTTATTAFVGGEEVVTTTTMVDSSATNSSSDNQGSHSEDELTSEKELSGGITSDDDASFTGVSKSEVVESSISTTQLFESEVASVTIEETTEKQQDVEPATASPEVE